jgi:hypothetical protein
MIILNYGFDFLLKKNNTIEILVFLKKNECIFNFFIEKKGKIRKIILYY